MDVLGGGHISCTRNVAAALEAHLQELEVSASELVLAQCLVEAICQPSNLYDNSPASSAYGIAASFFSLAMHDRTASGEDLTCLESRNTDNEV